MEIERKYLVSEISFDLDKFENVEIQQGYICTQPAARIRRWNEKYIFTIKTQNKNGLDISLAREETEVEITEEEFYNLKEKVEGSMISKTRYFIPLDDFLTAELDIYYDNLYPLKTVEVEFSCIEQAQGFIPPLWFGTDVTFDKLYCNSSLAAYGLPK